MLKNKKRPVEERIEKESNRILAKMYYLMNIVTIISIIAKLCYNLPVYVYALEIISLATSCIFCVASELKYDILFLKNKDEELLSIHYKILSKAMMISFWIIITGEFLFIFIANKYIKWTALYFAIWGIPALIITFFAIKNGWLIWGTKKKEKDGKKELAKRTAIGSIFFGAFMAFPMIFQDGTFHPEGLLWMFGMAVGWGIPFYLIFLGFMKLAENRADKNVDRKELEDEK